MKFENELARQRKKDEWMTSEWSLMNVAGCVWMTCGGSRIINKTNAANSQLMISGNEIQQIESGIINESGIVLIMKLKWHEEIIAEVN